ncbi:hypothetical protein [Streptomyces roseochromogenus]|uniref:Uncharacterized protein n=1 Tax=Streptomyces roseochromogenus subsp. oscitans DS 12.976 TaxID=1352936 RepID=V6KQU3_STRRC|nr:hypothetical protein [Streptomyces roseochromogenus]EST34388.1 hypothetical protein M878_10355 [Streptomyces roseochromogenus subsp. oscitans DS 12.976]
MTEPASPDLPPEQEEGSPEPAADDPEVVLHAADPDEGETPWCIGDMTAH